MKKEILKQKWYYRLLKILFILSYTGGIILLGIGFYFYFNEYKPHQIIDSKNTTIACVETDSMLTSESIKKYYYSYSDKFDETEIEKICDFSRTLFNKILLDKKNKISETETINKYFSNNERYYNTIKEYRNKGLADAEILNKLYSFISKEVISIKEEYIDTKFDAKFEINRVYKKDGSWLKAIGGSIGFFILSVLGLIIIMELIKRIFLYVITGEFKRGK